MQLSKWKILNSKEVRELSEAMLWQWAAPLPEGCAFLLGSEDDVFIITRDVELIDIGKINVESLGLYFGQFRNGELRLSIEGSQLVGKAALKNVLELSDEQARLWLSGQEVSVSGEYSGYVIVKHGPDFLGCGKVKNGCLLNFVPKPRRIPF